MGLLMSRIISLEMRQLPDVHQVHSDGVGALFTWGVCPSSGVYAQSWPLSVSLLLQGMALWDVPPSS